MMLLLVLVALGCGPGLGSRFSPVWYHSWPRTWTDARDECRRVHGAELLTVWSQDELDLRDFSRFHAWIGTVPHDDHFHTGKHGDECGLTTYREESPDNILCTYRHFFFCSGPSSDVFVPQTKSWDDADGVCGSPGISELSTNLQYPDSPVYTPQEFPVWIGLLSDGTSWTWGDGQESDYRNWASDLGSDPDPGACSGSGSGSGCPHCVSVGSQSKSMRVQSCSDAFPYVCHEPGLVLLQELLTWEQAEDHCKKLSSSSSSSSFRLLSVDNSDMNTIKKVQSFAHTTKVWVGLRFLAGFWFWSDGVPVSLSVPPCPDSTLGCGALDLSSSSVEPSDCSEKLNLLCYDPDL